MSKLIESWEELQGLKNDKYYIDVDLEYGSANIYSFEDPSFYEYLSTHTFYGSQYQYSTAALQEYGFDVQIKNWDGPTEEIDFHRQWELFGHCNVCQRKDYCTSKCRVNKEHNNVMKQIESWKSSLK